MKVLLCGAQGVGKTTLANLLVRALGGRYEVVDNVSRDLVREKGIEINRRGTMESQREIFRVMYDKTLGSQNNDIVSCRSLVDVLGYTLYLLQSGRVTLTDIDEQVNVFGDIINAHKDDDCLYVYVPIEFDCENDGLRDTNEEYRRQIAKNMRNILTCFNIPHVVVSGSVEERARQVLSAMRGKNTPVTKSETNDKQQIKAPVDGRTNQQSRT